MQRVTVSSWPIVDDHCKNSTSLCHSFTVSRNAQIKRPECTLYGNICANIAALIVTPLFVPQFQGRHRLQCLDIARCFRAWYAQARAAPPVNFLCDDKLMSLWFGASCACHKRLDLNRWRLPRIERSLHIVVLKYELSL